MILNSLVEYYESLVKQGKIAEPGWSDVNVSFALWIDENGHLEKIVSLRVPGEKNLVPQKLKVPTQVKRASGILPNFLCDNSSYFLGIDNKGKPERSINCFKEAGIYHKKMLGNLQDNGTKALLLFFENWDPHKAEDNPAVSEFRDEIIKGGNLVFCFDGRFIHESDAVREIWDRKTVDNTDSNTKICMVTGKRDQIATLHPSIKGIKNAQSSGASLVSFNAPSFCSYGKEQGMNAQTGEYAAMAYGAALNHLIENLSYKQYIGDTAVLCYAMNGDDTYKTAIDAFLMGEDTTYTEQELNNMILDLCAGNMVEFEESNLDPNMKVNILGIAPNAARLSVRFYYHNSFGTLVDNIYRHNARLEIGRGNRGNLMHVSLWKLLRETCREGGDISSLLAGEMIRSILLDEKYPATLINAVDMRIRADHKINDVRAAIIKAYYVKNNNKFTPKEVLTVSLNKETDNVAYNLGRLFAVLEKVQQAANPSLNATIRDKFFGGASATPSAVFPHLIDLSQKHLRKLNKGSKVYYEKIIGEIMDRISDIEFPKALNMPERGIFQLGYYHQVQELYKGKNSENGGMNNE